MSLTCSDFPVAHCFYRTSNSRHILNWSFNIRILVFKACDVGKGMAKSLSWSPPQCSSTSWKRRSLDTNAESATCLLLFRRPQKQGCEITIRESREHTGPAWFYCQRAARCAFRNPSAHKG